MGNKRWRAIAVLASGLLGTVGTVLLVEKRAELQQSDTLKIPCAWPDRARSNRHLVECKYLLEQSALDISLDGKTKISPEDLAKELKKNFQSDGAVEIGLDGAALTTDAITTHLKALAKNGTIGGKAKIFHPRGPGVPTVKEGVAAAITVYAGLPAKHYSNDETTEHTAGLYYGGEVDSLCPAANSPPGGTVCDLGYQLAGSRTPEFEKNWRGSACGQTAQLRVEGGALKVNLTPPLAGRESAYLLGARIQALKCHAADILGQLNRPGTTEITLRDPVAIQMAKDFNTQVFDQYKTTYLALGFKTDELLPLRCQWNHSDEIEKRRAGNDMNTGPAIHACALRALMASAFTKIIAYEIFARMQTSFTKELLGPEAQKTWAKELEDSIGTKCNRECGVAPSTACVQGCYDREIGPLMKAKFDSLWPLPTYAGSDRWPSVLQGGAQCK